MLRQQAQKFKQTEDEKEIIAMLGGIGVDEKEEEMEEGDEGEKME